MKQPSSSESVIVVESIPILEEAAWTLKKENDALLPLVFPPDIEDRFELKLLAGETLGASTKRVSVIIPTYQRERLLVPAVVSVKQSFDLSTEVIVVNDSPQQLSSRTLTDLSKVGVNLKVLQHKRNLGLGAARNTGSYAACGEALIYLDDDDEMCGIEHSLSPFLPEKVPPCVWYGDYYRRHFQEGACERLERITLNKEKIDEMYFENQIPCGAFLVSRQAFLELGGFHEALPVHEDYHFHLRAMAKYPYRKIEWAPFTYNLRTNIHRMNLNRRAYWYATSILNHALYNKLFNLSEERRLLQIRGEFEHLNRAIAEGLSRRSASQLVNSWWRILKNIDLKNEVLLQKEIINDWFPEFNDFLE